jgi:hypothetical protein
MVAVVLGGVLAFAAVAIVSMGRRRRKRDQWYAWTRAVVHSLAEAEGCVRLDGANNCPESMNDRAGRLAGLSRELAMLHRQAPRQRWTHMRSNISAISEQLRELSQQAQDLAQAMDIAVPKDESQGRNGARQSSTLMRNEHRAGEFADLSRLVRTRLQVHTSR